ncbi:DUF1810 domain-containing protein [Pseudobacter ginsenosidimutans]|uniref:Uncharacterized protein (DUF1810 family) n=1 Tax=Pseudobacter ginsenosidimutans TaxID=661488 RepID=A0A4Q7N4L2_9BACT|nr:DUF1810 domain-containing protein [Pseudobacter ginsenosidimutans]QEC44481.1 DUF1810 domain-containing protein [Pseudobacter ginsenosidimutans]RZS75953.1 uncharacterized protein (DUF1810 family) [Pseudobacter ginsenosidimutans]
MTYKNNLTRFLKAQEGVYDIALTEIRNGKKSSRWMWFIFPQIYGLGSSETSNHYAIRNMSEAREYLDHEILGPRLTGISNALLKLPGSNPIDIFGSIDSMKLQSSMTLFSLLAHNIPVFEQVLNKYFDGVKDEKTVELLNIDIE